MLNYLKKFLRFFKVSEDKKIINNLINKHLPRRKLNYNSSQSLLINYKKEFLSSYLSDILPLAFKKIKINNDFPKILDIGCGFGPMCLASKIWRDIWLKKKLKEDIYYVGIDTREDSINYNKRNFNKYKEIIFIHHKILNAKIDYIGDYNKHKIKSPNYIRTEETSDGKEGNYKLPFLFKADIQWSNSLITHVTPQALDNILKFTFKHLNSNGVSLNTCNIIDPESLYLMKMGMADRNLKYDFGPFMTYHNTNPLLNTAYKIDYLNKIYKKNKLKIIEIIPGRWRNLNNKNIKSNQNNIYLDTIVAKKIV
jgi:SAM-dependent methyltransferase